MRKLSLFLLLAVVVLASLASPTAAQTTLRVVMHSDLVTAQAYQEGSISSCKTENNSAQ